jgi:hypothetical protein
LEFYIDFAEPMLGFRGFVHWMRGDRIDEHRENWNPFEESEEVTESADLSFQQTKEASFDGKQASLGSQVKKTSDLKRHHPDTQTVA